MRERLERAGASAAHYDRDGAVDNWPEVVDAILAELATPDASMVTAGEEAQEEDWETGDYLGWRQIPVTFTAMINSLRNTEKV